MPMLGVVPSFDGFALFGPAPYVRGWANPVARQTRGFLGTNGLVTKTGGSRGSSGEAVGVLFALHQDALYALIATFETYKISGKSTVLIDTMGVPWLSMIMTEFRTTSEIRQDSQGVSIEYRCEFLGLTQPYPLP